MEVAQSYNNIGAIYAKQGNYEKALEHFFNALTIQEIILGREHSDVASSFINIGSIYADNGNYTKAIEYCHNALTIIEKLYGMEHIITKQTNELITSLETRRLSISAEIMRKYVFIATVINGNSSIQEKQLEGNYIVLEFADWNIDESNSLFEIRDLMKDIPKTIVLMKDDTISQHFFENTIGVEFSLKQVGQKEKDVIRYKYHQWKELNQ